VIKKYRREKASSGVHWTFGNRRCKSITLLGWLVVFRIVINYLPTEYPQEQIDQDSQYNTYENAGHDREEESAIAATYNYVTW
jgi:hypothetical protein